jgi:hypothetical protein
VKKILVSSALLTLACGAAFAAVNASDLVKVTGKLDQKCVEYYTYNGESYCSLKPISGQVVDPAFREYETQNIVFDDRPWQAAWGKKSEYGVDIEYVPMGEDINDWHELITSQFYPGLQKLTTPKQFAYKMIAGLKEKGFDPVITVHQKTPDEFIYEFRIEKPAAQAQDELQMIRSNNKGIYILHYVIKKSDMGDASREKWLKNLKASTIKSS